MTCESESLHDFILHTTSASQKSLHSCTTPAFPKRCPIPTFPKPRSLFVRIFCQIVFWNPKQESWMSVCLSINLNEWQKVLLLPTGGQAEDVKEKAENSQRCDFFLQTSFKVTHKCCEESGKCHSKKEGKEPKETSHELQQLT